jgi:hypothetical protein
MSRVWQAAFLLALGGISWHLMQAVHELGHVVAAIVVGRTVERIVLHPLEISRTEVAGGTTLVIAAAGPLAGIALPLAVWGVVRIGSLPGAWLAQFFAAFCLVANGAYIGGDAFVLGGDGKDLIRAGVPVWLLVMAGGAALVAGLLLLRGVGAALGFGDEPEESTPLAACAALAVWGAVVGLLAITSQ